MTVSDRLRAGPPISVRLRASVAAIRSVLARGNLDKDGCAAIEMALAEIEGEARIFDPIEPIPFSSNEEEDDDDDCV